MSFFKSTSDSGSDSEQDHQTITSTPQPPSDSLSVECTIVCKTCSWKCAGNCKKHCGPTHHVSVPKNLQRRRYSLEASEDDKVERQVKFRTKTEECDVPVEQRCAVAHCPLREPHWKGSYRKSGEGTGKDLPEVVKLAGEAIAGEKKKGRRKATVAEKQLYKKFGKVHELV